MHQSPMLETSDSRQSMACNEPSFSTGTPHLLARTLAILGPSMLRWTNRVPGISFWRDEGVPYLLASSQRMGQAKCSFQMLLDYSSQQALTVVKHTGICHTCCEGSHFVQRNGTWKAGLCLERHWTAEVELYRLLEQETHMELSKVLLIISLYGFLLRTGAWFQHKCPFLSNTF